MTAAKNNYSADTYPKTNAKLICIMLQLLHRALNRFYNSHFTQIKKLHGLTGVLFFTI